MTASTLEVTHYQTQVHLGWTEQEREHAQKIAVDITLHYSQLPDACISDQLNDTQCYAQLLSWIETVCQSKSFKLIEHLTYCIHTTLKKKINNPKIDVKVCVHKLHPPISSLESACFVIQD